jgi:hypothetical protein
MNMHSQEKLDLIDSYVTRLVDDMDIKTLCEIAATALTENLMAYTDQELATEVHETYPELLDRDIASVTASTTTSCM